MALGVYVAGGADGVFGQATKTAVTQFQRWNGLEPTGTVNEATARKLGTSGSTTPVTPPATPTPTPPVTPPTSVLALHGGHGCWHTCSRHVHHVPAHRCTAVAVRPGSHGA